MGGSNDTNLPGTFRVRIRSQLVKYIFHENKFSYLLFGFLPFGFE